MCNFEGKQIEYIYIIILNYMYPRTPSQGTRFDKL